MTLIELKNLHHSDYEHELDSNALDMLEGTPGLEHLTKLFIKHGIERLMVVSYTGSNLRVTPKNFPKLHELLEEVCWAINLHRLPRLYIECGDSVSGLTVGDEEPIIVITSGAVDRLPDDEMRFLLGHELGHIKSRHTRYHMMAESMSTLGDVVGDMTLGIGKLLSTPVQLALFRWYRMSELTADRLGLLACQSLNSTASVFVKMAGLPVRFDDSPCIEDFLLQAREFEKLDLDQVNRWVKFAAHMMHSHPWTVLRVAELIHWVDSGQYDRLLSRTTSSTPPKQATLESKEAPNDKRHCASCGAETSDLDVFCGNCGRKIMS